MSNGTGTGNMRGNSGGAFIKDGATARNAGVQGLRGK